MSYGRTDTGDSLVVACASSGVIEERQFILVRSRVPRTGAAFARRAQVSQVRSRATTDGGERPRRSSHAVARRARGFTGLAAAVAPASTSGASPRVRSVRRGGVSGSEQPMAAPRLQRLGAAGASLVRSRRRATLSTPKAWVGQIPRSTRRRAPRSAPSYVCRFRNGACDPGPRSAKGPAACPRPDTRQAGQSVLFDQTAPVNGRV